MQLTEYINAGFIFAERFGSPESIPELSRRGFIVNSRPQVQSDGLVFDGVDDHIVTTLSTNNILLSGACLICRFKTTSGLGSKYICSFGQTTSVNLFDLFLSDQSSGKLAGSCKTSGGQSTILYTTKAINDNKFNVLVNNYTGSQQQLYVNGLLQNSITKTGNIILTSNAYYLIIGNLNNIFNGHVTGIISHIFVVLRSLSATEIQQITNDLA